MSSNRTANGDSEPVRAELPPSIVRLLLTGGYPDCKHCPADAPTEEIETDDR